MVPLIHQSDSDHGLINAAEAPVIIPVPSNNSATVVSV